MNKVRIELVGLGNSPSGPAARESGDSIRVALISRLYAELLNFAEGVGALAHGVLIERGV